MSLRHLAVVSAAAVLLTACSSSSDSPAPDKPEPTKASPVKLVERSPLTGKPMRDGRPDNPVFVVKIENTGGGAPQYGLNNADMVIEELVEGGLTRLAAFYYSKLPSKVGHVRSLRTSDIGIAGPVRGQIVASGGANGAYNKVENAGITVFSEDAGSPGFSSDPLKSRPYNRLINLKTVNKSAKVKKIKNNYFPWTPSSTSATPTPTPTASAGATAATEAPATKTQPATAATVRFSNSTSTSWAYKAKKWVRTNGHAEAGKDFEADTMIVISCRVGDAGYTDPAGNPVPETVFEGSGEAKVFHGGTVTTVKWNKPSLDEGLTFKNADGSPFTIKPGKVFLELMPKDAGSVSVS
ncbi:DUF3048 domain-containing protein [Aeromicrobium sp. UC242_57]|uniref:DUF3048 domain-containing protein n=1 Tax=Aeromicrobium sp. UC242_57 TaxID=3374624 RepID=UPI0037B6C19E